MENTIPEKFLKPYNHTETEATILRTWDESGFFNPDVCIEKGIALPSAPHFSIVLPPPNVTGSLHTGHALMLVLQDIMVRHARMKGMRTLWLPGTDHAAIATQSKVEKILEKEEGLRKSDLGRDAFLERVQKFAADSHDTIVSQCKSMGASLDWSREAFTLDETRNKAVRTIFKQMYDDGLIYRKERIINWDPKGQTTISDDEIVHEPRKAKMYTFRYSKDFPIAISTTRPETKVGDTAVAVHPEDPRYKDLIGKKYEAIFCGVPIHVQIVGDESVDPLFGTGALGVTPAHSQIDWEIAERHKLPIKQVINEYAKMMVGGPELIGKKVEEARTIIIDWLQKESLLENMVEVDQNVSTAERSGAIIEPLPKLQWFIDVNKPIASRGNKSLKELMLEPVREGAIKIIPDRFEKEYFNWIENLRDWCISRQIWYGHRIPVWYRQGIGGVDEIYVNTEAPEGEGWIQDEDTLDTWFSSGLWTFSTLGWPDTVTTAIKGKTGPENDFANYLPTTMLETGQDILFFWIARMVLMSQYALGQIPFENAYLHGMVRSADGKKMSKSLGEKAVDPIDIIKKYGNDALRMAMIVGNTPGNDLKLNENDIRGYGKFVNKIWNASRFVLEQTADLDKKNLPALDEEDTASNEALRTFVAEISKEMEEFRYSIVAEKVYHYFWDTFASGIIERSKAKILEGRNKESAQALLYTHLVTLLTILHPFTPFVTEEIWSTLGEERLLLVTKWPHTIQKQ